MAYQYKLPVGSSVTENNCGQQNLSITCLQPKLVGNEGHVTPRNELHLGRANFPFVVLGHAKAPLVTILLLVWLRDSVTAQNKTAGKISETSIVKLSLVKTTPYDIATLSNNMYTLMYMTVYGVIVYYTKK